MISAVSYLRMSTDAQEASIAAQRLAVSEYAAKHGYRIIREYVDSGISGDSTEKRVEFQRMLRDADKRDFKVVLCWNQDRFGRFDLLEAGFWIQPLRSAGVSLVTVTQGSINWEDFAGRLIYSIEQEAKKKFLVDLSWNVNRGKLAGAKLGLWMGGPAPYGYQLSGKSTLAIDQDEAEIVRLIFDLFAGGMSLTGVARELNHKGLPGPGCDHWNRNAVGRIVDNPLYAGVITWNRTCQAKYSATVAGTIVPLNRDGTLINNDESKWTVADGKHPAIVTQEQFDAAHAVRDSRSSWGSGRPATRPILFRGLAKCGRCGATMHGEFVAVMDDVAYVCSSFTSKRDCDPNRTYQKPLTEHVGRSLREYLLADDVWRDVRNRRLAESQARASIPVAPLVKRRAATAGKLSKAESRLLEVPSDMVPIVSNQIRELRDAIVTLDAQITAATAPQENPADKIDAVIKATQGAIRAALSGLQSGDPSTVNELIRGVLSRIDILSSKRTGGRAGRGRYEIDSITIHPIIPQIP